MRDRAHIQVHPSIHHRGRSRLAAVTTAITSVAGRRSRGNGSGNHTGLAMSVPLRSRLGEGDVCRGHLGVAS